jgi:3-hydroxyisobutyrate dehydrogenase-like beta-hydroxyacid dehydrogenase
MQPRVGVIGIGTMGSGIAANLLKAGLPLTVFDFRPESVERLRALGARTADSPRTLGKAADIVFVVVPDHTAVRQVLFGAGGLAAGLGKDAVVVDMTTSDPHYSPRFAARLARRGIRYLDAPMTGGAAGARDGQLLMMVGGDRALYDRCLPVFRHISKQAIHVGPVGSGHRMKLLHNHVSHAVYAATCEAVALGETLGLRMPDMMEVFNAGNARSYTTEIRFPRFILAGSPMGATYDIVCKDMTLARRLGARAKFRTPLLDGTYRYWKRAVEQGRGRDDWATIVELMKEWQRKAEGGSSRG